MAKKKGLGRDITKSLEAMESLQAALEAVISMPLKRGLVSSGCSEDTLNKSIKDAMMKAYELKHIMADVQEAVRGIKIEDKSSRFAAQRVISSFFE